MRFSSLGCQSLDLDLVSTSPCFPLDNDLGCIYLEGDAREPIASSLESELTLASPMLYDAPVSDLLPS